MTLSKTLTGASRGISLAIGKRAAADGANMSLLPNHQAQPLPARSTAAEEIKAAGAGAAAGRTFATRMPCGRRCQGGRLGRIDIIQQRQRDQ
jgi:NAD(P)-dependent dehydrogenase (short-subunit alcohol dehydrogenase family)